jgi:putative CocE/NonD family hydrolase
MTISKHRFTRGVRARSRGFATILAGALACHALLAQSATSPPPLTRANDIPADFKPLEGDWDYERLEVMIPMRDGVKLHTVIMVPKGHSERMPILLTRTPYEAAKRVARIASPHLTSALPAADEPIVTSGYIRVYQDIRGKYKSEGKYISTLPLRGPLNPGAVDHSTDAWDTIEWLVHNVPACNGRVGITGTSYDGYLTLMALIDPHPALKAAVPVNPMVDGWIGDDWFHHGAFRPVMIDYIYKQTSSTDSHFELGHGQYDDYSYFLAAGASGELGRRVGADRLPFWQLITEHPAYDEFWQLQAVDGILRAHPSSVPTLFVHGLYDQEDIYGAPAAYQALEASDRANDRIFLVIGPWHHGQSNLAGAELGAIKWGSDTAQYFREHVLQPFLDHYLKDGGDSTAVPVPPVLTFETGRNVWRRLDAWPQSCAGGCVSKSRRLYLEDKQHLAFDPPPAATAYDEYVSDPAKPVPYRVRPIRPLMSEGSTWRYWLADDQRPFSDRPDVLSYTTDVLTEPLTLEGTPLALLYASTSGTDADWVVKLIDVYPDEVASRPELGGYQLIVSADIFRGRYRESTSEPRPLPAGKTMPYRIPLPLVSHTFLPGHRVMVQIQSTWFPLYDRNPQTFVPNIFWARPEQYRKATQRIYHSGDVASAIELPVVVDTDGGAATRH